MTDLFPSKTIIIMSIMTAVVENAETRHFPWAALERSIKRAIKKQLDEGVIAFLHVIAEEHRLDVSTLTAMWEAFQTEPTPAATASRAPRRRQTIAPTAAATSTTETTTTTATATATTAKKKRRMSAYNFFCKTERQAVLQKYPETTSKEVVKRLASEWKGLSNTEKAVWKDRLEEHLNATEEGAEEEASTMPSVTESVIDAPAPASPVVSSPVRRHPNTPESPPFHAPTPTKDATPKETTPVAPGWDSWVAAERAEPYSPTRPNILTEEFEAREEEEEEEVDLREGLRRKLEGKTEGQLRKVCSKYGIRRVAASETSKRDMIDALMNRLAPMSP
ncbi:hypothetical protein EBZ80_18670 [bacterium]|nr:hypothetical protein [bacterium]